MWVIKNRNPAFGWYNFEGWTQDESKATQYSSEGLAKETIARFGMQANAIELEQPQPPTE
jgi:hypothetical protein